jgi:hypothetical protein
MAQIYSGSIVTIAGPAAPDANSGFIFPRNTPRQAALELIGDNNKEKYILSHSGILRSPYRVMPEEKSPLAQRGWVLQERLLSQRTLYFGSHNMYLECFTNVRFDSCYYPIRWHYQTVNMAEKKLIMPLEDANARFQYWLQIITTYGQTLLSKPTDKLPALSALASEFHRATGCRYLAGVWQEDLYRMLTWYTHYFLWQDEPSPRHISQEYVAPSWSWASANHILGYMNLNYEMRLHTSMDIIEVKVTPSGIDPFGTVKDGYLRVRGKSRPAVLSVDPHPKIPSKRRLQVLSETSASELLGRYNPDYGNAVPSSGSRLTLLYLGWFDLGRTDRKSAVALAIEPYGPRQGAYKRVGLACTETLESGDSLIGYFDGVEREEFLIY